MSSAELAAPRAALIPDQGSSARRLIPLHGELRMRDADALWPELSAAVEEIHDGTVTFDLTGVSVMDGGILSLLLHLRAVLAERGARLDLSGANERIAALIELYGGNDRVARPVPKRAEGLVEQVGRATVSVLDEARLVVEFLGQMVVAAVNVARRPRTGNWHDTLPFVEKTGVDALPIVLLINTLVGFVMAFQAAKQLAAYGANIYVADLVGLSVTRELAPLMTAIIVCGRSGAAIAAELGTMKVSEEIDALRIMGFGTANYLVLPRALALLLVVPVLTLLADIVGIAGGMLVASISLGVSRQAYWNETLIAVHPHDVGTGLIKSAAFAMTIALIACQQGFATSGGAEGVGRRATSTVVASLFCIVLIDTLFTVLFRALDV
ncbi:MlaE family lipid ABC transporter permease subunit [Sorangium sp. So ce1014]|uniref:ABC transporter permease n=1 Tax=Sorangium sp. So ce1014 TaxID=3133326 RepID=UPI003F5DB586